MKSVYLSRFLPLLFLLLLALGAYFLGAFNYLNFDTLRIYRHDLTEYVNAHFWFSGFMFILFYAFVVSLSLPIGLFMTMLGGFLFAQVYGTLFVVIGGTLGACVIFLAARHGLGDLLKKRAKGYFEKMKAGFQENEANYLLFLRLVPLFPFWVINIIPAFFNVRLFTFFWTTLIGIIPATFVYAQAGTGLAMILDKEGPITISVIFNWQLRVAFILIAVLALAPVIYRKVRKYQKDKSK